MGSRISSEIKEEGQEEDINKYLVKKVKRYQFYGLPGSNSSKKKRYKIT